MTHHRMDPKERSAEILDAALVAAERHGLLKMTRDDIARIADVSPGLVSARLGTMGDIRRVVMRHAVRKSNIAVLSQGLALRDKHALRAPEDLKKQALEHLLK